MKRHLSDPNEVSIEKGNKKQAALKHLIQNYGQIEFASSSLRDNNNKEAGRGVKQQGKTKTTTITTAEDNPIISCYGNCTNVSERYEKLNRIGEGTYGTVYRARDKVTNCIVALKRCFPHHEASDGFPITTLRELSLLRECRGHSYIVHLREIAVSSSRTGIFLVFDYCEHELGQLIDVYYSTHRASPFRQEAQVKRLLLQLLLAVQFLHQLCIVHRDIKMSNLLYQQSTGQLKLADFGLARRVATARQGYDASRLFGSTKWERRSTILTPKVVSLWYRPPEILLGSDTYDETCDTWSVGCVFAELLLGTPLIRGTNEMDQIQKMFDLLGVPNISTWPSLPEMPLVKSKTIDFPSEVNRRFPKLLDDFSYLSTAGLSLLSRFFTYDYKRRLTASEGLQSEYFREIPTPTEESNMPVFQIKHNRT